MHPLVKQHEQEVAAICAKHDVQVLELFGSAARGEFDPETSDLDFLVLYQRDRRVTGWDALVGLKLDLESLFQRNVDVVDVRASRNPIFLGEALKHRERVYAA